MKRILQLLIPLLVLSLWLSTESLNAAKDQATKTRIKEPQPNPTSANSTKAALDELRAKLEGMKAPVLSPGTGEQIPWSLFGNGGSWGTSSSWQVATSVGQVTTGHGCTATPVCVYTGFQQSFPTGGCCVLAGDFDHNGSVDISDLTGMVDYMFAGGAPPVCFDEGDVDASCGIDISDLTYRVDFMFGGGPAPVCGCAS